MDNDILTKRNERVKKFFALLDKMLDRIEVVLTTSKPSLIGERFLTDVEMAKKLKISRRTLQLYRTEGNSEFLTFNLEVKPCIGNPIFRRYWIETMFKN